MQKKGKGAFLGIIIGLLVVISVAHTAVHFVFYQTGVSLTELSGISGRSINNVKLDESFESSLKENYPGVSLGSKVLLIFEWIAIMSLVTLSITRTRMEIKKEAEGIEHLRKKEDNETDVDLLYEILKRKRSLRFSTIEKIFKVNKSVVTEWGKVLEDGRLAAVNYPRIGEPEILLKE